MSDELTKARETLDYLRRMYDGDLPPGLERHLDVALAEVDRLTLAAQSLLRALDAQEDDSEEGNVGAYLARWADDVYEAKSNLRAALTATEKP